VVDIMPPDPDSKLDPPAWIIEQGEDEDYVEFIVRQGEAYSQNPPPAPPGFELIECDAEPRHWPFYSVQSEGYPPACPHCVQHSLMEAHEPCEHDGHGTWRRWKLSHWAVRHAVSSGLLGGGYGHRMGGGCRWCLTSLPSWRAKRRFVLWVSRDTWRCILQGRHLPGDPVAFGYCSKCLPCPSCGTTTAICSVGCGMSV